MLIKRTEIQKIKDLILSLSKEKFNIKTQYKLIKINKAIKNEEEIYQEQIQLNCEPFFERDKNGVPKINESGGYKIKEDKISECYLLMNKMNNLEVQLPDLFFSFDELEELNLNLEQLEVLEPFIKD